MKHKILNLLLAAAMTLSLVAVPAGAESASASETATGIANERVIFDFLTEELNLPVSSACGLLASAYRESRFQPEVQNSSKTSIGIFQWYGVNMDNLVAWCNENGYDPFTLDGQFGYLTYQFTEVYPFNTYYQDLLEMPETAQGTYEAGYYFAYYFERPADRAGVSALRGNFAMETFWPAYEDMVGKIGVEEEEPVETWDNPFWDVDVQNWFYESVGYVYENEVFSGISETSFAPAMNMSRAMMVQVLYNLEGQPEVDLSVLDCFEDVDQDAWYAPAIAWAKECNVVNGMSETEFWPTADITREQMVNLLYKYTKFKEATVLTAPAARMLQAMGDDQLEIGEDEEDCPLSEYPDAEEVSYGYEAMKWAVTNQVISGVGTEDGVYLEPDGLASRAQVATLFHNYCEGQAAD